MISISRVQGILITSNLLLDYDMCFIRALSAGKRGFSIECHVLEEYLVQINRDCWS